MTIIVGLEGVLARHEWRQALIESEGWDAYHAAASQDAANDPIVQLVNNMHQHGHHVHCITSRPEKWRQATIKWMANRGILVGTLYMRGEKDFRTDVDLRTEIVSGIMRIALTVTFAVDENEKACDVYRAAGIPTLQLTNPQGAAA